MGNSAVGSSRKEFSSKSTAVQICCRGSSDMNGKFGGWKRLTEFRAKLATEKIECVRRIFGFLLNIVKIMSCENFAYKFVSWHTRFLKYSYKNEDNSRFHQLELLKKAKKNDAEI